MTPNIVLNTAGWMWLFLALITGAAAENGFNSVPYWALIILANIYFAASIARKEQE
jgi:hypothetical protein